jgi:hypothetical protein
VSHDAGVFFYADDPVVAVALTEGAPSSRDAHEFCAGVGAVVYRAFAPDGIGR